MNKLKGKKTYIAAGLMALQAIINIFEGNITFSQFLVGPEMNQILGAFGLAALRSGVESNKIKS